MNPEKGFCFQNWAFPLLLSPQKFCGTRLDNRKPGATGGPVNMSHHPEAPIWISFKQPKQ
jgi:hypothetical protein